MHFVLLAPNTLPTVKLEHLEIQDVTVCSLKSFQMITVLFHFSSA